MEVASGLDLAAADARVLHNSNKLALRLLPCDVVARVAFAGLEVFQAELEIGRRLAEIEVPMASLEPRVEPRVYKRRGFVVTFWTYYEQAGQEVSPADYAKALQRLHAGMAKVDVTVPHFSNRVAEAQQLVASPNRTPELEDSERKLLSRTLGSQRREISERTLASNSCMESHTRATCSTRRAGHCSSISRHVAVGLSSSTSLMCRKRSASAIPALIKNCFARAASSFWQWSPRGAGIETTNSRMGNEQGKSFLAPYAKAHRGRHSTS
jgi:hypothetical protein